MSYQAITDIIVNPNQLRDLQLSSTVKDSPNTSSSVSFADFLASYTSEEPAKPETTASEAPKAVSEADVSDKTDKLEDNSSEKSVDKAAESESDETVEKTEAEDSDKKVDDKKQIKEKTSENKEFAQKSAATPKSEAASSTEKKEQKTKDNGKQKKLSEKDFSRLEEIAERAENLNDSAKSAAVVQNVAKTSDKLELKDDSDSDSVPEITVSTDASSEIVLNQTADNKSETSDFDFSGSKGENKKQFALDKDGKITVEDQRTKLESETEPAESKKSALKTSEIRLTNDSTAVMSVELNPNAEADVLSLNTQTAASNGSNFQAMLSNQLSNVAPEFVKAGNLVLKDNNQGTINLVLHPDDLGNVKIHLSLDGKTLSGHITVATKEALQVFKDNAETLREAFIKNGFDAANFDVAMNNGGSFNQNMGFEGQNDGSNLFARRAYGNSAGGLSAELDSILENAEDISNYSVNIVA